MQDRFVKTLADAVCLRMPRLGLGMFSVIYAQIKLVIMRFQLAAVLGTLIRQDADNTRFLCSEERHNTAVEQICSGDGRLGGVCR